MTTDPSLSAYVPSGRELLAQPPPDRLPGSNAWTVLLILAALVAVALGVVSVTTATMGVWMIGAGCLLAILARIAQARYQHVQILHSLRQSGRQP